jgi:predicted DNA-binding protein YlxM (UPF0122 family)
LDKCPKCGMLMDLCVCEILDKQGTSKIKVYTESKKFKKRIFEETEVLKNIKKLENLETILQILQGNIFLKKKQQNGLNDIKKKVKNGH